VKAANVVEKIMNVQSAKKVKEQPRKICILNISGSLNNSKLGFHPLGMELLLILSD
jgi:hypothetical protein